MKIKLELFPEIICMYPARLLRPEQHTKHLESILMHFKPGKKKKISIKFPHTKF